MTAKFSRSRGADAPELWGISASSLRKEGARNAGRPVRPQPRVQNCRKHTSVFTTKAPNRPAFRTRWSVGLLRALPGNGRNLLAIVSAGSRRRPDLDASAADRISVGTTRLGPPRKAIRMGRISAPVRTAQRRRPPRRPASRRPGFGCRPLYEAHHPLPGRALADAPRRDAAASTTSRPADRDDRETPLSMGRDAIRHMILWE
jgi:hypothetical protein